MITTLLRTSVCLAALSIIIGCGGGEGPERIVVSGKVERGGQPLGNASISYLPADGHQGPAATTGIVDGRYSFTAESGPVAGPHQVVIRLSAPGKDFDAKAEKEQAGGPSSWQLKADVPEQGPWEKDFVVK